MNWLEAISKTISYIEDNLDSNIEIDDIASNVYISSYYLQKGFSIMCGYSIGEYIRNRRLSLAGKELINGQDKVIDIAIKYGYDSPDSFTKAFTRFHGATPNSVRNNGATIKEFSPLRINIDLKGGYTMEYKIEEKVAFKVVGLSKTMKYENAYEECPKLWQSFYAKNTQNNICSKYGINIDSDMCGEDFEYLIGDDYNNDKEIPQDFVVKEIPKHTWAIFPCVGSANKSVPTTTEKIFKEWLPNSTDYEIAAGYNIEMYSDPTNYQNGVQDEKYYCEIWVPIIKK